MTDILTIPLLQEWLDFAEVNGNNQSSFSSFVSQQLGGSLGRANVDVRGSSATALYSGQVNGRPAFQKSHDVQILIGREV